VLPSSLEPFPKQPLELQERRSFRASQHLQILWWELERSSFKPNVTRGIAQDEPKVDVNEVSVSVKQNVAVVPILYLEKVSDERVPRKRLGEIPLCPGELG
jgi:hypothetical protein